MTSIGDRRTFFLDLAWRLPDLLLVIAGPFREPRLAGMAYGRGRPIAHFGPTKHLSKPYLFKQREAGYRPPAWTRILDNLNGLTEQSVLNQQLRKLS